MFLNCNRIGAALINQNSKSIMIAMCLEKYYIKNNEVWTTTTTTTTTADIQEVKNYILKSMEK